MLWEKCSNSSIQVFFFFQKIFARYQFNPRDWILCMQRMEQIIQAAGILGYIFCTRCLCSLQNEGRNRMFSAIFNDLTCKQSITFLFKFFGHKNGDAVVPKKVITAHWPARAMFITVLLGHLRLALLRQWRSHLRPNCMRVIPSTYLRHFLKWYLSNSALIFELF